jgi:hypothetical protein
MRFLQRRIPQDDLMKSLGIMMTANELAACMLRSGGLGGIRRTPERGEKENSCKDTSGEKDGKKRKKTAFEMDGADRCRSSAETP